MRTPYRSINKEINSTHNDSLDSVFYNILVSRTRWHGFYYSTSYNGVPWRIKTFKSGSQYYMLINAMWFLDLYLVRGYAGSVQFLFFLESLPTRASGLQLARHYHYCTVGGNQVWLVQRVHCVNGLID